MKTIITCCIFILSFKMFAQVAQTTPKNSTRFANSNATTITQYEEVDNYVLNMTKSYSTISELAKDLTKPYSNDSDKVRAIFRWMTENISYDCKLYKKDGIIPGLNLKDFYSFKDYYYAYAQHTLVAKKGICSGYAYLFYELCKTAGINCYVVSGITNKHTKIVNFFRKIGMFNSDHAWNKVMIDNKWYFVDVTWASGNCNRAVTRFYKQYNSEYYLVETDQLYSTHAEEKTESADFNDLLTNTKYPEAKKRRPFLNIFYYSGS